MHTVDCHVDSIFEGEPSGVALSRRAILSYGTGHVLNDLTASCWFTYLLVFLTDIGLSPRQAASVMLSGQLADGAATILIGQLIDIFGHFKLWLAGGSVLVALSFSSVFGGCVACAILGTNSLPAETVAYSTFAAIFNIGWAATQVSHMSLVNCITANSTSRVALNSCRNAFTMVANLMLFAIAFAVFTAIPAYEAEGVKRQYQWIAGLSVGAGSCFVLLFLAGIKEPRLYHHTLPTKFSKEAYFPWFSKILYYQVALVYMLTRLATNVSQALLAFYLVDELLMGDSSKALVPAVIYISSFLTSVGLQVTFLCLRNFIGLVIALKRVLWEVQSFGFSVVLCF
ncbi:hypothetical protein O6H91_06G042500 [Diphasiastrum complanatum]|uniref:Uncharacterized protein n=1 Tax=Diphasiastrum complanatum TaxID=34168 RepID=A0ACC2DCT5_DIPCM|nr:hypothetical protein O6H91_06G042500 [Diphasiastrum complanatum]